MTLKCQVGTTAICWLDILELTEQNSTKGKLSCKLINIDLLCSLHFINGFNGSFTFFYLSRYFHLTNIRPERIFANSSPRHTSTDNGLVAPWKHHSEDSPAGVFRVSAGQLLYYVLLCIRCLQTSHTEQSQTVFHTSLSWIAIEILQHFIQMQRTVPFSLTFIDMVSWVEQLVEPLFKLYR